MRGTCRIGLALVVGLAVPAVAKERALATPNGLITNGGGVEVLDPVGKVLAVTGS